MTESRFFFLIPARSGSKGFKNKNIYPWKGKPLIMHSYDYLISENYSSNQIIISTDSKQYIDLLMNNGVPKESLLLRPSCLAEDNVVDYPVALHAWSYMEERNKSKFDFLILIRPTSPIRPKNIIEKGLNIMYKNKSFSSLRAMRKVSEHPYRIWIKDEKEIAKPLINKIKEPGNIPRQYLEKNYFFQSGELEICRRETLQSGSISGDNVGIIEIEDSNPDIDSIDDI